MYIERLKFYQRNQKEDEVADDFITDVRKLSLTCEFGEFKDQAVRDRVVFGLKDQKVKEKIIFSKDLSLMSVIEKIRLFNIQKIELQKTAIKEETSSVDKVVKKEVKKSLKECTRCGTFHKYKNCPAFNAECFNCKTRGHYSTCCKKGKKVDAMEADEEVQESEKCTLNFDSLRYVNTLSWYKKLKIDNRIITFKLDTGAQINTITENLLNSFRTKFKITDCKVKLQAYFGGIIKPVGKVILPIVLNTKLHHEEFIIVKGNYEPLLGLKSCVNLNLISRLDMLKIDEIVLNKNEREKFINHYHDVFEGLGKFEKQFKLYMNQNAVPFAAAPQRIPLKFKDKVLEKLNEMENDSVISKVNEAREWINNIVVVEKGEKVRICIDPKHLNNSLMNFRYPIPSLDELKQDLKDAQFFSVLDLKDGFWHVELDEDSRKLCTFSTPFGVYQFNRLPFGIKIASETFQKYMFDSFGDLKGVKFYIDDIIVFGKDLKDHDLNLKAVMKRAREKGIKFNSKKVQFTEQSVKFFGHILSKNQVAVDSERIKAISRLPIPSDKNDIQKFLGVVNYIRNFVPHLPELTHNIRNLLKKESEFIWLPQHQQEFEQIKNAISESACCSSFDEKLPLELETDASSYGLGACLKQGDKIISYASRCLSDIEKEYGQIEKEFLAMAQAIENLVSSCHECNTYSRSNKKEPLISHEIPLNAFEKVGCDILQIGDKNYLILVDYFSKWICCKYLTSKTSSSIISKWIEIFSDHGVPKEIIADNMPFSSSECKRFAEEWDVKIITSSPHYPQSNGLAEKAVGIVKNMMRKTIGSDQLNVALMNYNNTPLGDIDLSPSQLSQNRRMRTKIISNEKLLQPRINTGVKEKIKIKNQKTKTYYNRNVTNRKEFQVGQNVWLQKQNGLWEERLILKKMDQPRSFEIKLKSGSVLRRNSKFLRIKKSGDVSNFNVNDKSASEDIDPDIFFDNFTLHHPNAPNASQIPQQTTTTSQHQDPINQPILRRSSRIPKPVMRYT